MARVSVECGKERKIELNETRRREEVRGRIKKERKNNIYILEMVRTR